jgi:hypothetical protein
MFIRDDGLLLANASFLPHPLTCLLPLLHRNLSGAISQLRGMFVATSSSLLADLYNTDWRT